MNSNIKTGRGRENEISSEHYYPVSLFPFPSWLVVIRHLNAETKLWLQNKLELHFYRTEKRCSGVQNTVLEQKMLWTEGKRCSLFVETLLGVLSQFLPDNVWLEFEQDWHSIPGVERTARKVQTWSICGDFWEEWLPSRLYLIQKQFDKFAGTARESYQLGPFEQRWARWNGFHGVGSRAILASLLGTLVVRMFFGPNHEMFGISTLLEPNLKAIQNLLSEKHSGCCRANLW